MFISEKLYKSAIYMGKIGELFSLRRCKFKQVFFSNSLSYHLTDEHNKRQERFYPIRRKRSCLLKS